MKEVTLVLKYRTDSYDEDKAENYPADLAGDVEGQVKYDLKQFTDEEADFWDVVDPESIVDIQLMGVREC